MFIDQSECGRGRDSGPAEEAPAKVPQGNQWTTIYSTFICSTILTRGQRSCVSTRVSVGKTKQWAGWRSTCEGVCVCVSECHVTT